MSSYLGSDAIRRHAAGRHVRRPDRLYLRDVCEARVPQEVVVVGENLVKNPDALEAVVVDGALRVEVVEIGAGGEHDANLVVRMAV